MAASRVTVGLQIGSQPPLGVQRGAVVLARLMRLDSVMAIDHFENIFPTAIWDEEFSWLAARRRTPHEHFDFQVLLGHLAARAGWLRLGVGVTDTIRRHPVVLAQAMLTLAHMTRRAPILGVGAGERLNIDPYGLDFGHPVGRLEEALQIIRMCFSVRGPISFAGEHFTLDGALMEIEPPAGRTPEVWIAGHGPRMLELTARYGDGWYPTMLTSASDYASKLDSIRVAATGAGRDADAITPALHCFVVVAPTEREARSMLRSKAMRIFAVGAPAHLWRRYGAEHPFGEDFRGYVDLLPERCGRSSLEAAIAAVPSELMVEDGPLMWGTPEQVAFKIRSFGDAGLRHVVLAPVSGLVSRKAALYAFRATRRIARLLADAG